MRKIIEDKRFLLSMIVNVIAIFGFIGTLLSYSYTSGQKDSKIITLEQKVESAVMERSKIKEQIDEQGDVITTVNAKLDLLLDHFNIANGH